MSNFIHKSFLYTYIWGKSSELELLCQRVYSLIILINIIKQPSVEEHTRTFVCFFRLTKVLLSNFWILPVKWALLKVKLGIYLYIFRNDLHFLFINCIFGLCPSFCWIVSLFLVSVLGILYYQRNQLSVMSNLVCPPWFVVCLLIVLFLKVAEVCCYYLSYTQELF